MLCQSVECRGRVVDVAASSASPNCDKSVDSLHITVTLATSGTLVTDCVCVSFCF